MSAQGLEQFVAYVEQGVFPEMLVSLKRCKNSNDINEWMDSLGDYLADHERMKNYKPPPPKALDEIKETEDEEEVKQVQIVEPDDPIKPLEPKLEDSMAQRVFANVRQFDDQCRVVDFEEEELEKEQQRALSQFEDQCAKMQPAHRQQHDDHLKKTKKDMIAVIAARQ